MKLKKPGISSLSRKVEILNLSPFGMWLLVNKKEYFVDYEKYPWFRKSTIEQIEDVQVSGLGSGVYWPKLDIDVELDALDHPERYPLVAKIKQPSKRVKRRVRKSAA
jgi:hypothetical protein